MAEQTADYHTVLYKNRGNNFSMFCLYIHRVVSSVLKVDKSGQVSINKESFSYDIKGYAWILFNNGPVLRA